MIKSPITDYEGWSRRSLFEIYKPILKFYKMWNVLQTGYGDVITLYDENTKQPIFEFTVYTYKRFFNESPYIVTTNNKMNETNNIHPRTDSRRQSKD